MTKQDLPKEIFILSIELPRRGAVDAQFRDEKGDINIPVFRDLSRATDWLRNGGLELWKQQDSAMQTKLGDARCGPARTSGHCRICC